MATTVNGTIDVNGAANFDGAADFNDNVSIDGGASGAGNGKTLSVGQYVSSSFAGPVAFSGATTAVTQSANDNSTKVATTAYVDAAITAGLTWSVVD